MKDMINKLKIHYGKSDKSINKTSMNNFTYFQESESVEDKMQEQIKIKMQEQQQQRQAEKLERMRKHKENNKSYES